MSNQQDLVQVSLDLLVEKCALLFMEGYRLVQIGVTKGTEGFEVNYSFDRDLQFLNYRVILGDDDLTLPSIGKVYPNAYLYENEIHDLFGITVTNMTLDFQGHFYDTAIPNPFNPKSESKEVQS